jgi:hypothetical protein
MQVSQARALASQVVRRFQARFPGQVAVTLRIDINLEVGSATDAVTVTEATSLLKTESGELSHNVTNKRVNDLPAFGIGPALSSNLGVRNPQAVIQFIPGGYLSAAGGASARAANIVVLFMVNPPIESAFFAADLRLGYMPS